MSLTSIDISKGTRANFLDHFVLAINDDVHVATRLRQKKVTMRRIKDVTDTNTVEMKLTLAELAALSNL